MADNIEHQDKGELVANCDWFNSLKHSTVRSYAFTEQGVAMLSTVLRSETAIRVSIRIMDAFVAMRRFMVTNAEVFQRLSTMDNYVDETVLALLDKRDNNVSAIIYTQQISRQFHRVTRLADRWRMPIHTEQTLVKKSQLANVKDEDGIIPIETMWDAANVAMGVGSLINNIKSGRIGDAAKITILI